MANKANADKNFDCIILGGGLVGLTAAAALSTINLRSALIEKSSLKPTKLGMGDPRTTAIAASGQVMLETLGIWAFLEQFAEPILDIRVSEKSLNSFVHYNHHEASKKPMGYIVENSILKNTLIRFAQRRREISIFADITLKDYTADDTSVRVQLADGSIITGDLLIAADGSDSYARDLAGIQTTRLDYRQTSIVFSVAHSTPHFGVAHERFLSGGPIAFLPMKNNMSSAIWTEETLVAKSLMELEEAHFLEGASLRIEDCLGRLKLIGKRAAFPLSLINAETQIADRLALIGDSAHKIHPIAGQGFNLGLRDIAHLADKLGEAKYLGLDAGSPEVLRKFQASRDLDKMSLITATDSLNRLFSNNYQSIRMVRGLGLSVVNRLSPLKRLFMSAAMGNLGDLPNLLRGKSPTHND